jgi:hypothetical protein
MNRQKLLNELDRIIDVGIVNAHHDKEVLQVARKTLDELWNDIQQVKSCKVCAFTDIEKCSPDADVDSPAFIKWRDCGGSMKQNRKWRLEDDDLE